MDLVRSTHAGIILSVSSLALPNKSPFFHFVQMHLSNQEIAVLLEGIPETAFTTSDAEARIVWVQYVHSVDEDAQKDAKSKHPTLHYVSLARRLAEAMGSLHPRDYEERGPICTLCHSCPSAVGLHGCGVGSFADAAGKQKEG